MTHTVGTWNGALIDDDVYLNSVANIDDQLVFDKRRRCQSIFDRLTA